MKSPVKELCAHEIIKKKKFASYFAVTSSGELHIPEE